MDLSSFPADIFDIIISFLTPTDVVRCQQVQREWRSAFSKPSLTRLVLLSHFPHAREVRSARADSDWTAVLRRVTARYHFLARGTPCCAERLPLAQSFVKPDWCRTHPVGLLRRELQFEKKKAPFQYRDTLWTYSEGLLVFPSETAQRYRIYDLSASRGSNVELLPPGSIVRRMRLCARVLVVEWCGTEAIYRLKDDATLRYRHFATAWDVLPAASGEGDGKWVVKFRCEWKIHFLGLPLDSTDRFYSTHNAIHYALYRWQYCHTLYGEEDPIEFLGVWDISTHHPYRPSEDATGQSRPLLQETGAIKVRDLSNRDIRFYNISQGWIPRIRELQLDDGHVYMVEEDHRWLVGTEARNILPRLHRLKSTGIPFADDTFCCGPAWVDECGADGDVHLSFCQRTTDERRPGLAPCWRHEEFPYLIVTDVYDAEAGVRFTARQFFMLESISISFGPSVCVESPGSEIELDSPYWRQLLNKGKLCGDERWIIGENEFNEVVILYFDWEARARLARAAKEVEELANKVDKPTGQSRPVGWRRSGNVQEWGSPKRLVGRT